MKILDITLDRLRLELRPPLHSAWDPEPRRHFDATIGCVGGGPFFEFLTTARLDP